MTSHPRRSKSGLNILQLIEDRRAALRADTALMQQRPAGMPRFAWRSKHSPCGTKIDVVDISLATRPRRRIGFNEGYEVFVWKERGDGAEVIERIDLQAPDAVKRLGKFRLA